MNNLKVIISNKTQIPIDEFKLFIKRQYPKGTQPLTELGLINGDVIDMKFGLKGG